MPHDVEIFSTFMLQTRDSTGKPVFTTYSKGIHYNVPDEHFNHFYFQSHIVKPDDHMPKIEDPVRKEFIVKEIQETPVVEDQSAALGKVLAERTAMGVRKVSVAPTKASMKK